MINKHKVSVIIPTYKRPDKLEKVIRSVMMQTYKNIEVIIVDDNEQENIYRKQTENIMEQFINCKNVRYIKHDINKGAPTARNTGFLVSSGKYINFLDDDDTFMPKKIEKQMVLFETSKLINLGVVYCKYIFKAERDNIIRYSKAQYRGNVLKHHLIQNLAATSSILFSRKCIDEAGLFDKDLICGHEHDLLMKIFANGYQADFVDEVLLTIHIHNKARISTNKTVVKGKKYLFNKKRKMFFHQLSKKEMSLAEHNFHLSLFRDYRILGDYLNALLHYYYAVKYYMFLSINLFELIGLFIPYKYVIKIKGFLHQYIDL